MAEIRQDTDALVAQMVADSGQVRVAAEKVLAAARSLAAAHVRTGDYERHFGIEQHRKDVLVFNDHPAAVPIEFGHTTPDGKRVPGQHIMLEARRAAG